MTPRSTRQPRAAVSNDIRPRRRRWWLLALLALAPAPLALVLGCSDAVEATRVERRDVTRVMVLTGRVRPPTRPSVGATTTGIVRRVLVREGEQVRAGQLLVQLDDAQARAAVAEARAALVSASGQAQAVRTQAATALAQAERDLERTRRLYEAGAVSTREVEAAVKAAEDARAIATAAQARAAAGNFAEEERAQAALAAAEARLANTRITAPEAGTVIARLVDPGVVATPGQPLLQLAAAASPEIVAYASEDNLADLRLGASALISADAYPAERFGARITWIAPAIDPAQGTVEVRFSVSEPPAHLIPDMTVSVNIEVASRPDVLVVPRAAVRGLGTPEPWVLVDNGGQAERRRIEVGIIGEAHIEVVGGLVEGEFVLPASVQPGARVRVRN